MTRLRSVGVGVLHYWPVLVLILAWDAWVVVNGYSAIVAPRPWSVFGDILSNATVYAPDLLWTLGTSVAGVVLGMALGTTGAVLASLWAPVSGVITPSALILRSVPVTAMIPVLARVFGYEERTVLVVTAIISFFPAFVLVLSALAGTPGSGRDLFRVFGASRVTTLVRLQLPHAVPNLLIALRVTAPAAVLSAMLAEFLIGRHGLGFLFVDARSYMQIDRAWGTALVATALSVAAFVLARGIERRMTARFT